MTCKCEGNVLKHIESKYKVSVFKIQYACTKCGQYSEQGKNTEKGIGFKRWVDNLFKDSKKVK